MWMFRWALSIVMDDLGRVRYAKPMYTQEDRERIRERRKALGR